MDVGIDVFGVFVGGTLVIENAGFLRTRLNILGQTLDVDGNGCFGVEVDLEVYTGHLGFCL